jgi:hypothetical protein
MKRFLGMPAHCPKCADGLFCPDCTEEYGQGFARSARAEALEEAARVCRERSETHRDAARTIAIGSRTMAWIETQAEEAERCEDAIRALAKDPRR